MEYQAASSQARLKSCWALPPCIRHCPFPANMVKKNLSVHPSRAHAATLLFHWPGLKLTCQISGSRKAIILNFVFIEVQEIKIIIKYSITWCNIFCIFLLYTFMLALILRFKQSISKYSNFHISTHLVLYRSDTNNMV